MRLILMGTGPFAVPSFRALKEFGHDIAHVITKPIVPMGKKEIPNSPVRQWAIDSGLPIFDPQSINEASVIEWLATQQADLMFVCDYGQILSKSALVTTRLGGINLHGSLLPRHRGAAPVQWSILSGDQQAGVSTIHMSAALDAGPVLHRVATPIGTEEDAGHLEHRLSELGVEITLASVNLLGTKKTLDECVGLGEIQNKQLSTKAPRLSKEDGEINCHYPIAVIDRLVRGLQPWPSSFAHIEFPDQKILRVIVPQVSPLETEPKKLALSPGDLLFGEQLHRAREHDERLLSNHLYVAALDGLLAIPFVQPAGKRRMASEEFLRGYSRYPSMRFSGHPNAHGLLNQLCQK